MSYLLEVCMVATLSFAANVTPVAAQSQVADPGLNLMRRIEAAAPAAQAMQKGISVQLPVTSNAVPMPDADKEDSLIVSITDDGSVYFGINPINSGALAEEIKDSLANVTGKNLYLKADARTPYANVWKVLDAVRTAGVVAPNLLTAQPDSSNAGTLVPPKGLEVLVGSPLPPGSEAAVVQVLKPGQRWPTLKINDEQIPWATLQSTLKQVVQNRRQQVILVKAEGILPFADVVEVVDMCRLTGATVILVTSRQ